MITNILGLIKFCFGAKNKGSSEALNEIFYAIIIGIFVLLVIVFLIYTRLKQLS